MQDGTAAETRLLICTQSLPVNVLQLPERARVPVAPLTDVRRGYKHFKSPENKVWPSSLGLVLTHGPFSTHILFPTYAVFFPPLPFNSAQWQQFIHCRGEDGVFYYRLRLIHRGHAEALFNIPERQ